MRLVLRPALTLSLELRRRRWGGVWSPLLPLGGWGGFAGSGWALTAHICLRVVEGLSWLLSTPGVGVPSQHFWGAEHTASPRQLRWAAGCGLGRMAMWGALGTGQGEALLQEDVGACLSDPRMGGEPELLPSDMQAPRLIPG